MDSLDCIGASGKTITLDQGKAEVTIKPGDNVTCTYTNKPKGELIVKKETDPNGSDKSFTFTPTGWNGGSTFPLKDGEQKASGKVLPGDYSVAETVPTGWDLSSIDCDAGNPRLDGSKVTVTVGAGQTVTCTFNNTRQRNKVELVKEWVNSKAVDEAGVGDHRWDHRPDHGHSSRPGR